MEFIEAVAFTKYVYDYLTEDEFLGLQSFLSYTQRRAKLFLVPAVSEKFVGQCPEKAKVAVCG